MIATTFAIKQLYYMSNWLTGFDHEQVVNVKLQNGTSDKQDHSEKRFAAEHFGKRCYCFAGYTGKRP